MNTYDIITHESIDWEEEKAVHEVKVEFKYKTDHTEYVVIATGRAEVKQEFIPGSLMTPADYVEEITAINLDSTEIYVEEMQIYAKDCPLTEDITKDILRKHCA